MNTRYSAILVMLLTASAAVAQTPPDATTQARERFQAGMTRAQQGDLHGALEEFEAAYAIRPHYSVLYNIGQARLTLGRPVEAALAFEKYLADGGSQIPPARHEEVVALLLQVRARIGELRLVVPAGSSPTVWLDGRELPAAELTRPLALAVGEHTVIALNGAAPGAQTVTISHDAPAELRLAPSTPSGGPLVQLVIRCAVPDVTVDVPGLRSFKTPLKAPLLVTEGAVSVRFSRPGYVTVSRTLMAKPGELAEADCDEHPLSPLPSAFRAELSVTTSPPDADVFVDDEPFSRDSLPLGVHRLRVEHEGYTPFSRSISLSAGKRTSYESRLIPTAATRERERRAGAKQRTIGLVVGGAGLALLGTGAGVYAWNSGRYDEWRSKQQAESSTNTALATNVQRADDIALGLILVGAAATITGSWTFWDAGR
jgi:hypothetical protein